MDNFRDSYFKINWDLTTNSREGTCWGKQYDTGRGFVVTVINGDQVVMATNEVLRLKWEKPDNTSGYVNATIVNGKFVIENIDQMFTVQGSVRADFELSVGGKFVASTTFYVSVEKAVAVDSIESSSDFTALHSALLDVGTVQDSLDGYVDAESVRAANESIRIDNESDREAAEGLRVSAETDREAAEALRQTGYATMDEAIALKADLSEIEAARGTEPTLGARLDSTDAQLNNMTQDFTRHKLDYATQSEFKTTNLVANGDFSNGTTGWTVDRIGCNVTALNNTLFITGNGTITSEPRTYNRTNIQIVSGHKYYIKALAKITNNNSDYISLQLLGSVTGIRRTVKSISAPIENVEYEMSGVYTIMDTGELRVGLAHKYIDIATSNGKTLEARYVFAMDLTETFGVGNEPTADEMDLLMKKYPNSWFITANLLTFKESYLELLSKIKTINNTIQVLTPSIGFIDNPITTEFNNQAMVTLSYDDGFLNNYNLALPLHEKYGIPATFNIITSNITNSKFMNAEKILNCHHRGVEIASHSHNHVNLPNSTDEEIIFECAESKQILESIIGVGEVETIAIPFSQYDDRVKDIVSQYFKGIRVYGDISNSIPPADRYHLHSAIAVGNTTTFEQVKTVIDYAITNNRWSIIMLHGINNGTKDQYEISQRLLDEILKYIAMQGRDRLLPVSTKDGLKLSLGDTY